MKVRTGHFKGTSIPFHLAALAVLTAALVTSRAQDNPVKAAPELPTNLASTLEVVPGRALLATKIRVKTADQTHPPCTADSSSTYYECRITTPITLCTSGTLVAVYDQAFFSKDAKIAHFKLSGAPGTTKPPATLFHFPIYCSTSDGPWSASLESDRECAGVCSPQNSLQVLGIPNLVEFFWGGAFGVPPAGATFKFVAGSITKIDFVDRGRCHPNN